MNQTFIQKAIGLALILSGVMFLTLKIMSLPESKESWNAWADPSIGTSLLIVMLLAESLFLAARLFLGYILLKNKYLQSWAFYPLVVLLAISGLSGIILCVACLAIRFWQGQGRATKT